MQGLTPGVPFLLFYFSAGVPGGMKEGPKGRRGPQGNDGDAGERGSRGPSGERGRHIDIVPLMLEGAKLPLCKGAV